MKISNFHMRWILLIKLLSTVVPVTYCCSSRIIKFYDSSAPSSKLSTKLLPSSMHPLRKNTSLKHRIMSEKDSKLINSILLSKCSREFDENYCEHGGRCFNYTVANYSHPSCECTDGYMGERCEVKYFSLYHPIRRAKIRAASVCFSAAAAASLFSAILLFFCQHRCTNYFSKSTFEDG